MLAGSDRLFAPPERRGGRHAGVLLNLPGVALADAQPADYAMFGEIDFQHHCSLRLPIRQQRFYQDPYLEISRLSAAAIPDARVLARFDGADPAVVECGSAGAGFCCS